MDDDNIVANCNGVVKMIHLVQDMHCLKFCVKLTFQKLLGFFHEAEQKIQADDSLC